MQWVVHILPNQLWDNSKNRLILLIFLLCFDGFVFVSEWISGTSCLFMKLRGFQSLGLKIKSKWIRRHTFQRNERCSCFYSIRQSWCLDINVSEKRFRCERLSEPHHNAWLTRIIARYHVRYTLSNTYRLFRSTINNNRE